MTVFNDSSTGYSGVLPDDRNEARDDGLLNQYAHMYDVIKEDRYREKAIESESAERASADAVLQKNIDNINSINPTHVDEGNAVKDNGMAFGTGNDCKKGAIAVGRDNTVGTENESGGICVGDYNTVGMNGISIGYSNETTANSIGIGATVKTKYKGVTIGAPSYGATKVETNSTIIGYDYNVPNDGCVAIGTGVTSTASNTVAIGANTNASGSNSVCIGRSSESIGDGSIAIGYSSEAPTANTFSIGNKTTKRRIIYIQDPIDNSDAASKGYVDTLIPLELSAYLKTLPDIEYGYVDVGTIPHSAYMEIPISFTSTKTEAPSLFLTPYANTTDGIIAQVKSVSTTSATVVVRNYSSTSISNITLDWLAISGR